MILLTKEAHSTYCLTMAQYCPQLGQLFAIAGHKMKRREENFGRSTIAIRNMLSGYRMRGFAREKPYSQFYPSPYHEVQPSLKTEAGHNRWLNMGSEMISHPKKVRVKGGEGWVKGQLHPSPV